MHLVAATSQARPRPPRRSSSCPRRPCPSPAPRPEGRRPARRPAHRDRAAAPPGRASIRGAGFAGVWPDASARSAVDAGQVQCDQRHPRRGHRAQRRRHRLERPRVSLRERFGHRVAGQRVAEQAVDHQPLVADALGGELGARPRGLAQRARSGRLTRTSVVRWASPSCATAALYCSRWASQSRARAQATRPLGACLDVLRPRARQIHQPQRVTRRRRVEQHVVVATASIPDARSAA